MLLRLVLVLFILFIGLGVTYIQLTKVSFKDQRGSVSNLYCRILGKDAILQKPVIFIPGVKGSLLSQAGEEKWLHVSQVLFPSKTLMYSADEVPFVPTGVLTRLVLLPWLGEYAPYQRISAYLACNRNAYFFSYDWRKNPAEAVPLLGQLVERVQRETGQKPSIIAHSMGGLVTHAYLKTHADTIDKVVYASVPFNPGIGFLTDLEEGSSVGLNKTILSKEAVFSFPSSLALLPHAGQRFYKNQDLMKLETWKENKLSVFKDGQVDDATFTVRLNEAMAFQRVLDTPANLQNQFLFVVSNCHQTVQAINPDGSKTYEMGDGRVPEIASYPVEKDILKKQVFYSCVVHDQQTNDKDIIERIFSFLNAS